uniref:AlNc14C79G5234 protein n=1 Tax=Albugo laibachii Nc14 TaxID=890382 RepID=F0WF40_9STRA|nr:AlNc14C79G5234 [Albugo laibachii Nc14]|eukprot:CCA19822.1 AlNc14C79G5234 [Albugo laibachii Nc14]
MALSLNFRSVLAAITLMLSVGTSKSQSTANQPESPQENLQLPVPNANMGRGPGVVIGTCGGMEPVMLSSNIDVWLVQQSPQIKDIFRCSTFPDALGCSCQASCAWNPSGIEGAPPCMSKDSNDLKLVTNHKKLR